MTIKQADIDGLLQALDDTRQSWIEGRVGWGGATPIDQDKDMTIFGPFGGEAGGADNARQAGAASAFRGGTGSTEVVRLIVEGDLVIVVAVERNEVVFDGESEPRPWILRTTQVFRHAEGQWLRLHRHADPLIHRRSLGETRRLFDS